MTDLPSKRRRYDSPMFILILLFFMWGFFTVMNDVLIPYLKEMFVLSHFQSMLVQFAFFGAYFLGSLLYYVISVRFGDPINRIGYKNGMIIGLLISAIGSALFYPATVLHQYGYYLLALFVVGLGFVLLQITANPYVAILGEPRTASSRLNLAQGFNSLGTTLGPLVGGFLIFRFFAGDEAVRYPYLGFAVLFILLAILLNFYNLPRFTNPEKLPSGLGALKFRHLVLGFIAIFAYVGAEVSIGSIMISFLELEHIAGLTKNEGSTYVAIYWGGLMIGRFSGAISLGAMVNKRKKYLLMVLSTLLTLLIIYVATYIKGGMTPGTILPFLGIVVLNYLGFVLGRSIPQRTLLIFALAAILMLFAGVATSGRTAMWAIVGIGLFNSIMWSNIFTLSIDRLGEYTSQGSSLLVMMILGGAIVPLLQGAVADFAGVQLSFVVPMFCYAYIAYYAWKGYQPKKI